MTLPASDSSAAQVESNLLFEKDVLHTAGVLLLPVAIIALVLLYCASGKDRWKTKLSAEERPLKLAPHSKSAVAFVAVPIVEEKRQPQQRDAPPARERAEPTGVFLGVRPNSIAMRSTGF